MHHHIYFKLKIYLMHHHIYYIYMMMHRTYYHYYYFRVTSRMKNFYTQFKTFVNIGQNNKKLISKGHYEI